jgi:hypothetical protein
LKALEEKGKSPEQKAEEKKYAQERAAEQDKREARDKGQQEAKLSEAQKKALADYTTDAKGSTRTFTDLNKCLRVPSTCRNKEESAKFAKELDSAVKKLPKNDAGDPFYRGVNINFSDPSQEKLWYSLANAEPGTVLRDPGFGSYSANRRIAEDFTRSGELERNILFVSRNKALTPINRFSNLPLEEEALLPRRTAQTVRSVTQNGRTLIVELD